jgi:hypothetical protein
VCTGRDDGTHPDPVCNGQDDGPFEPPVCDGHDDDVGNSAPACHDNDDDVFLPAPGCNCDEDVVAGRAPTAIAKANGTIIGRQVHNFTNVQYKSRFPDREFVVVPIYGYLYCIDNPNQGTVCVKQDGAIHNRKSGCEWTVRYEWLQIATCI